MFGDKPSGAGIQEERKLDIAGTASNFVNLNKGKVLLLLYCTKHLSLDSTLTQWKCLNLIGFGLDLSITLTVEDLIWKEERKINSAHIPYEMYTQGSSSVFRANPTVMRSFPRYFHHIFNLYV